jgi:hypothetical protein
MTSQCFWDSVPKIPKERRSHLHRGGNLKSLVVICLIIIKFSRSTSNSITVTPEGLVSLMRGSSDYDAANMFVKASGPGLVKPG